MLDDKNVLAERDRSGALDVAVNLFQQAGFEPTLTNTEHDGREIKNIIIAGMGGSALAADMAQTLLFDSLATPFDVIKGYDLPAYAGPNTLVVASSHSGNTEETIACIEQAIERGCQIAVMATGGNLVDIANSNDIFHAQIPHDTQPRMAVIYGLKTLLSILMVFGIVDDKIYQEIAESENWLKSESATWAADVPTKLNYAKQLALLAVGKTPVFYGGTLMTPLAYKWKISWNENAKNLAFYNSLPEFNHNEFIGWVSHPVDKPFVIFDLSSDLEHPRIIKRFALSDKLLSGKRPKANIVPIQGKTLVQQLLWGSILADFASIYLAILNGIDPTKVELIEKFKKQLG